MTYTILVYATLTLLFNNTMSLCLVFIMAFDLNIVWAEKPKKENLKKGGLSYVTESKKN